MHINIRHNEMFNLKIRTGLFCVACVSDGNTKNKRSAKVRNKRFLLKSVKTIAHTTAAIVFAWLRSSRGTEKMYNHCSRRTTVLSLLQLSVPCSVSHFLEAAYSRGLLWACSLSEASCHKPRGTVETAVWEVHLISMPCWKQEASCVRVLKSIVAFLQKHGRNRDNEALLRARQAWNFFTDTFSPGWVNPNDFGDPATILLESDFRVKRLKISSGWTGMKMDTVNHPPECKCWKFGELTLN